jgi:predicted acyl esterase
MDKDRRAEQIYRVYGHASTSPIEVTGRVRAQVWSPRMPDTDFIASFCDVYPMGVRSIFVRERFARFREGRRRNFPEPENLTR